MEIVPFTEITDITGLVKESVISTLLKDSNIEHEFSIPDNIWTVKVNKVHINQVIKNLVRNAVQAMPNGGKIKVEIKNITVNTNSVDHVIELENGDYLKISIKDHGVGMSEEHLDMLFIPFFTTKQDGAGLELVISKIIIRKYGGYIDVESEIGKGTTFHIYFPVSQNEIDNVVF